MKKDRSIDQLLPHGYTDGSDQHDYACLMGDCMPILASLPRRCVGYVLTDIPYDEVNHQSAIRNGDKGVADIATFELGKFSDEILRVGAGSFSVFCGKGQVSELYVRCRIAKLKSLRVCEWLKPNAAPTNGQWGFLSDTESCIVARRRGTPFHDHCATSVWQATTMHHTRRIHRTEKPQPLLEYLIATCSNFGDIVLDPCMGSGAVGEAALRMGRRFIGIERDPAYYKAAAARLGRVSLELETL